MSSKKESGNIWHNSSYIRTVSTTPEMVGYFSKREKEQLGNMLKHAKMNIIEEHVLSSPDGSIEYVGWVLEDGKAYITLKVSVDKSYQYAEPKLVGMSFKAYMLQWLPLASKPDIIGLHNPLEQARELF